MKLYTHLDEARLSFVLNSDFACLPTQNEQHLIGIEQRMMPTTCDRVLIENPFEYLQYDSMAIINN